MSTAEITSFIIPIYNFKFKKRGWRNSWIWSWFVFLVPKGLPLGTVPLFVFHVSCKHYLRAKWNLLPADWLVLPGSSTPLANEMQDLMYLSLSLTYKCAPLIQNRQFLLLLEVCMPLTSCNFHCFSWYSDSFRYFTHYPLQHYFPEGIRRWNKGKVQRQSKYSANAHKNLKILVIILLDKYYCDLCIPNMCSFPPFALTSLWSHSKVLKKLTNWGASFTTDLFELTLEAYTALCFKSELFKIHTT